MVERKNGDDWSEGSTKPTTLDLFCYPRAESEKLRGNIIATSHLYNSHRRAYEALHAFSDQVEQRLVRLEQTTRDLEEETDLNRSSATIGKAYFGIKDSLGALNLSSQDFIDFFKLCVKINTRASRMLFAGMYEEGGLEKLQMLNATRRSGPAFIQTIEQYAKTPPEWFTKGTRAWKELIAQHSFLFNWVKDDPNGPDGKKALTGDTHPDGLPDWYDDLDSGTLPGDDTVLKEIIEDVETVQRLKAQRNQLYEQMKYSVIYESKKVWGYARHINITKREFLPVVQTFPELLAALTLTGSGDFELKPSEDEEFKPGISEVLQADPEKLRRSIIAEFTGNNETLLCPELVSLWIENSLLKSKVIDSAESTAPNDFRGKLLATLGALEGNPDAETEFKRYIQNEKRAYYSLAHDISPLLIHLTANEQEYLEELIKGSDDIPAGDLVMEIAEIVSHHSTKFKDGDPKETSSAIRRMKEFAEKYLNRNYTRLFRQMSDTLFAEKEVNEDLQEISEDERVSDVAYEVQTIKQETRKIQQSSLGGWKLAYTDNRSMDEHHVENIPGDTLEELEGSLENYIVKNGVSCSIKLGSVVRAFDWLVSVPAEVERARIRKTVGDVTFKKLKRGRVRILYVTEPEQKRIVFFLHQKKAWGYGF